MRVRLICRATLGGTRMVKLSALAVDLKDHVAELDINPLLVMPKGKNAGQGVKAADALIRMKG